MFGEREAFFTTFLKRQNSKESLVLPVFPENDSLALDIAPRSRPTLSTLLGLADLESQDTRVFARSPLGGGHHTTS